jgi:hypothetical protein
VFEAGRARRDRRERQRQHREAQAVGQRQVRWAKVSAMVALVGLAVGVSGIVVAVAIAFLAEDEDAPAAAERDAAPDQRFARMLPPDPGSWAAPTRVGDLGIPPPFTRDVGTQESHCDEWEDWLTGDLEAFPSTGTHVIEVSAPADLPVVIVDVHVEVLEHRPITDPLLVRCRVGAGGFYAHTASIVLESAEPTLEIESSEGSRLPFLVPPDQFRVDPGYTEAIELLPTGAPGFWEWTLELTAIVDQVRLTQTLGTREHPLRTFVGSLDGLDMVDWDLATCSWREDANTDIPQSPGEWTCGSS